MEQTKTKTKQSSGRKRLEAAVWHEYQRVKKNNPDFNETECMEKAGEKYSMKYRQVQYIVLKFKKQMDKEG